MKKILLFLLMLCCMTAAVAQPWPPGVYEVETLDRFKEVISHRMANDKCIAEIKLTADIYLNDCPELCRTFTGTLDGNGYTIYAGDENAHHDGRGLAHGKYLFTYSEGATFKNLTFKDFRADTDEHSNWSFLTSQATDGCVFENITFDHVSIWSHKDNVGAVAGYANGCTFKNITVKNGDFTVDGSKIGAVVGDANGCTFTNIEVNSCEVTADCDYAGGIVGYSSNNCTVTDIQIKISFIKLNGKWAGGVTGFAQDSRFTNCIIDDMSCVCADGSLVSPTEWHAYVGGVAGQAYTCDIHNCVNSALITADADCVGGIVGWSFSRTSIENCLNTGMIFSAAKSDVVKDYYNEYKDKQKDCVTKSYRGKEYTIKKMVHRRTGEDNQFGGIVGMAGRTSIARCANLGFLNNTLTTGGIIGDAYLGGTIIDCLSDGDPIEKEIRGIAGTLGWSADTKDNIYIVSNTLNVTANYDYYLTSNSYTFNHSGTYSYYDKNITENEVLSGVVCAKLGENWEQNIGIDPYPTPTGNGGLIFADNLAPEKYTYAGTQSNVTIKRTFNNDGWYSLCLPFDVDATQTAEMFAEVAEFSSLNGSTYYFSIVSHIEAGKAYIVKVSEKLENPVFENVTIAANVAADQDGPFVGVLKPTALGAGCKVIGSGTSVNPATPGTMNAFRCYFPASAAAAKAMYFKVGGGDATDIQSLTEAADHKPQTTGAYNLAGQKVDEGYHGIVIKNGKKYLIK